MKIKILETEHGTLVSVDGRAAYDSGNAGKKEFNNIKSLCRRLEIEVDVELKEKE